MKYLVASFVSRVLSLVAFGGLVGGSAAGDHLLGSPHRVPIARRAGAPWTVDRLCK